MQSLGSITSRRGVISVCLGKSVKSNDIGEALFCKLDWMYQSSQIVY